ncbi:hypothetical protein [Asticcacaulis biprosthecium]|uniref:hypothetical protein n=1 Tax=Asticcacaulis biprosthecium TaxID=76891 RepID=UPI0012F493BB|nr:hypothetical protein [Asticcacaulis biprosthecium]
MAAPKGKTLHRAAGTCFFVTMILLCASGLWLSLARDILFTVYLSWLAFHAVVTGWATAASRHSFARVITYLSPLSSLTMMAGAVIGAFRAASAPDGMLNGLPPGAFLAIAGIACLISGLDGLFIFRSFHHGARRTARHGWRMGFSMFLASGIFFFGNTRFLPEALHHPVFLATPVLLVVCLTAWFAIRARFQTRA